MKCEIYSSIQPGLVLIMDNYYDCCISGILVLFQSTMSVIFYRIFTEILRCLLATQKSNISLVLYQLIDMLIKIWLYPAGKYVAYIMLCIFSAV